MSARQTIVHGHEPFTKNLGILVCSFDVCLASLPFPFINYAIGFLHVTKINSHLYSYNYFIVRESTNIPSVNLVFSVCTLRLKVNLIISSGQLAKFNNVHQLCIWRPAWSRKWQRFWCHVYCDSFLGPSPGRDVYCLTQVSENQMKLAPVKNYNCERFYVFLLLKRNENLSGSTFIATGLTFIPEWAPVPGQGHVIDIREVL